MDCKAFKETVAAFALDALDEAERAACAAHLRESGPHDGCARAEADARAVAARLAAALPAHPFDPRVWRAIESRVQAEMAARPPDEPDQPTTRRREPAGGLGVAIIALALLAAAAETPSPCARAFRRVAASNVSMQIAR